VSFLEWPAFSNYAEGCRGLLLRVNCMSRTRTDASDLARLLRDARTPVYLLDEDQRIVYCNAACADWLGRKASELVGQQCKYHAPGEEPPAAAAALGLCPPPEAFAGHGQTSLVSSTTPDGRLVFRRGHFIPLDDGGDASAPILAILELDDQQAELVDHDPDALLHQRVRHYRHALVGRFAADRLIGQSPQIVRARAQILLAARSGAGTLVVGPQGSGKQHVAKAIHYSQDQPGLLVPLDCGLLETNVVRSALRTLGTRVGSRPAGSTLLLENVEHMPGEVQEDLREVLGEGRLQMRIVATSQGLNEVVAAGQFSAELACALSTLVIELPPLVARLDDLPLLVQAMVEQFNATGFRQLAGFTSQALDMLAAYSWPGNLDELLEVVREVHEKATGSHGTPHDLPKQVQWGTDSVRLRSRLDEPIDLEEFLGRVEKELIGRAMRRAKGNKSKAAKLLGLTRPRLYRRLVQLGLEQPPQAGDGHAEPNA
jgi:transcriptional regulator with PAS, ATPase and Fis domain